MYFDNCRMLPNSFELGEVRQVRLPAEFRFHRSKVYLRRDPATGDVILLERPKPWGGFSRIPENRRPRRCQHREVRRTLRMRS
jgi:virulence-associated protein VagC